MTLTFDTEANMSERLGAVVVLNESAAALPTNWKSFG